MLVISQLKNLTNHFIVHFFIVYMLTRYTPLQNIICLKWFVRVCSRLLVQPEFCIRSVLDFIIEDLPSVLILIISKQVLNESLCRSYKFNWCVCRCIGKLWILTVTFLINLSEICIIMHTLFWIKFKPVQRLWNPFLNTGYTSCLHI